MDFVPEMAPRTFKAGGKIASNVFGWVIFALSGPLKRALASSGSIFRLAISERKIYVVNIFGHLNFQQSNSNRI